MTGASQRPMPPGVRTRVITETAEVLPELSQVPPHLRKVANFAPARRARLGANQLAMALETDDEFRSRIAVQVAARHSELAEALVGGAIPAAADPADVAALLWLMRPDEWEASYDEVTRRLEQAPLARDTAERDRLTKRAEALELAMRELKVAHGEELAEARDEVRLLRRRLGEARASQRAATVAAESAQAALAENERVAGAALASTDAEVRRLRARVSELEGHLGSARRETRTEREEVTIRARLLLDTMIEASQGLRRELGLPVIDRMPGERTEAELALRVAAEDSASPLSVAHLGPTQLERHLSMPRARLIIDGYNVSKTAWPESALDAQRIRLVSALGPLVARVGVETTVVFDAAAATHRGTLAAPRGVRVVFSPSGVIADDVIRDLVAAEPAGRTVLVVSSDQAVARDVAAAGARPVPATALLSLLG